MVIGPSGVQISGCSRASNFTRGRFWPYEQDYPWIVQDKVQLPINHINNKSWGKEVWEYLFLVKMSAFFPISFTNNTEKELN